MFVRILGVIFPIVAIVFASYLYGRRRRPDFAVTNRLNMDLVIPALLLDVLVSRDFHVAQYGALAGAAAIVVLGSGLLAFPVAMFARANWKTLVPPMMFTNTGNLGIPLALFAFGDSALSAAVVLFIVSTTLHMTVGTYLMDHRAHWLQILRQPMLAATIAGVTLSLIGWTWPEPVGAGLHLLGQAAIPLMLIALGVRLADVDLHDWRIGLLGAVLCPATGIAMALLARAWLDLSPMQSSLLLLYGALPPAVINFLFAERYRQEPGKVAAIVLVGNLGSLVAIPIALAFALPNGG